MKIQSILTILSSVYLLCVTSAAAQEEPELPKGRLLYSNGSHDDVYLISYKAGVVTYRTSMRSLNILQAKKPALEAIYFYEPQIFTEAMNLYRAKNYSEAKVKFAECEVSFKPLIVCLTITLRLLVFTQWNVAGGQVTLRHLALSSKNIVRTD